MFTKRRSYLENPGQCGHPVWSTSAASVALDPFLQVPRRNQDTALYEVWLAIL